LQFEDFSNKKSQNEFIYILTTQDSFWNAAKLVNGKTPGLWRILTAEIEEAMD
jgi:hypothetical protein